MKFVTTKYPPLPFVCRQYCETKTCSCVCYIPVDFRAPPEITLAKDTPADELSSILVELADLEALASLNVPALCTGRDSHRSEPASSFHADAIVPAVPNTTASMPLLSSARINWSGVAPFSISPDRPKLTWPTTGWETKSPDQKLQAWEFTALSLETDGVINSPSLTLSRSDLLCKYNFLCLPGSAKPVMIK
uniref:Uncharacterized protein n=1 Tax=Magallana gigas TaxID=29159 RepID=K1QGM9_MAGGI